MAGSYFDSGARYDAGLYYDGFVSPPLESPKSMAKLKLDLFGKNAAEVIQYAQNIHTALTGNAYVTTPAPSLASMLTAITAADTANDAYEAEKDTIKAKIAARDAAIVALGN